MSSPLTQEERSYIEEALSQFDPIWTGSVAVNMHLPRKEHIQTNDYDVIVDGIRILKIRKFLEGEGFVFSNDTYYLNGKKAIDVLNKDDLRLKRNSVIEIKNKQVLSVSCLIGFYDLSVPDEDRYVDDQYKIKLLRELLPKHVAKAHPKGKFSSSKKLLF